MSLLAKGSLSARTWQLVCSGQAGCEGGSSAFSLFAGHSARSLAGAARHLIQICFLALPSGDSPSHRHSYISAYCWIHDICMCGRYIAGKCIVALNAQPGAVQSLQATLAQQLVQVREGQQATASSSQLYARLVCVCCVKRVTDPEGHLIRCLALESDTGCWQPLKLQLPWSCHHC